MIRTSATSVPIPSEIKAIGEGRRRGLAEPDNDIERHEDEEGGQVRDREVKEPHRLGDVGPVGARVTGEAERVEREERPGHGTANATASRPAAKRAAARGVITPVTRGRNFVRCMTASMSRSITMLNALAPPAARVPPRSVASMSHSPGIPCAATTIVGTVVTRSNSMMRGFVRAT